MVLGEPDVDAVHEACDLVPAPGSERLYQLPADREAREFDRLLRARNQDRYEATPP